ncbi:MAG: hypothetical protein COZ56_16475, partial [Armatimonadetes bacterium CG_4_8_14_3_um_filter_58_9]
PRLLTEHRKATESLIQPANLAFSDRHYLHPALTLRVTKLELYPTAVTKLELYPTAVTKLELYPTDLSASAP